MAISVLVSFAYFYQAGGWNQNSRYDLTRAIVEHRTIAIDAYHSNTGDKAHLDGHFYSDKAPGQSLVAVPVVALGFAAFGEDAGQRRPTSVITYAMTVVTSAIPAAVMALAIMGIAGRRRRSRGAALFAAVALSLATPMWAYATLFMGHALAASCLAIAVWGAVSLAERGNSRRDLLLGLAIGAAAGWAVVTEYPAAVPAALIALFALWQVRLDLRTRMPRVALGIAVGAGICTAVLLVYHQRAFGSPFQTPLKYLYGFHHVREQPFTLPRPSALASILFGAKRGLLPLAPVLVASVMGLVFMVRDRQSRALGCLCASIIVYYALFNASFATPMAGWSYGPRYMAAALPFWALALPWVWDRLEHRGWRVALIALAVWGVAWSLFAVSTTAQPPELFANPMKELFWPAFAEGDLSLNNQSFLELNASVKDLRGGGVDHDAFNLGELLGLRGHLSLVPLALVWGAASFFLWRRRREQS